MYGLALCLPRVGQPQGLPVPREIPKNLCGNDRNKSYLDWHNIIQLFT
ncbi:MAG: hypothetical protein KA314_12320 [Chloroflexi bacterium]|nr:hypothetical protein [Chloroflexota bacterium]MBP8056621.1 hypothetical protein [Chloroflexota bacterium]